MTRQGRYPQELAPSNGTTTRPDLTESYGFKGTGRGNRWTLGLVMIGAPP
jgi:hypothetical protein